LCQLMTVCNFGASNGSSGGVSRGRIERDRGH
jgi:hypothetical protein